MGKRSKLDMSVKHSGFHLEFLISFPKSWQPSPFLSYEAWIWISVPIVSVFSVSSHFSRTNSNKASSAGFYITDFCLTSSPPWELYMSWLSNCLLCSSQATVLHEYLARSPPTSPAYWNQGKRQFWLANVASQSLGTTGHSHSQVPFYLPYVSFTKSGAHQEMFLVTSL